MKHKLITMAAALLMAMAANAQATGGSPFGQDKIYVGASATGFGMNYNGANGFSLGLEAKGGYMLADNLMALGQVSYQHVGKGIIEDSFGIGVGGRYYIAQNGIYLGVNAKFILASDDFFDFRPGIEVGYAFFLNRTVTVEPAIYYDQSFKNHGDFSTIGLKVGVGVYLFNN